MRKLPRFLIIGLFLMIGYNNVQAQQEFSYLQLFTLGGSVDGELEYIFRRPQAVVTDSKGSIYVTDQGLSTIKVYDNKGMYLSTIGGKGRGPGEFQEISAMTINQDTLIIFDEYSQRFTKLGLEGEVLGVYDTPIEGRNWMIVRDIFPYQDSCYVLVMAKQFAAVDNVFGHFNSEFESLDMEFGTSSGIWDLTKPFLVNQADIRKMTSWMSGDRIVVTPEIFQPNVQMYHNSGGNWERMEFNGLGSKRSPYTLLDYSMRNSRLTNAIVHNGRRGKFIAKVHDLSIGIFIHQDLVLHFSIHSNEQDGGELRADVFDLQGGYLGYRILEKFHSGPPPLFKLSFLWKDGAGRFYLSDARDVSQIRVIEFDDEFFEF